MHGTKHLSNLGEKVKRAISPGRMSESPGKNYEKWEGDNTPYLHYYNGTITRNDIYTLANPDAWLEDNTINFWSEYLQHEELSKFPKANIAFMHTAEVSLLKNGTEVIRKEMFSGSDYVHDRITHIFLPVNDDREADHEYGGRSIAGGNHWSLLVVSLIDNVAFHYDSLRGLNNADARDLVVKVQDNLPVRRTLRFVPMGVEDAPQQRDGYNCGTFVCIVMKHLLLKRLLRADANQKVTMSMRGQDIDYDGARKMILGVIDSRRRQALDNNKVNEKGEPILG